MARKASRTTFRDRFTSSRGLLVRSRGFTIVELLIVVVVIAILAAITIVAFNGIQDRAKQSAAQAAAKQAGTKIAAFAIQNADSYPADLSAAGLTDGSGTTYQYRVNNAANPRTFCLTATTQNVSYYVSSSASSPTAGGCAGHGVNGVAAITNLHTNPGAVNATGVGSWAGSAGNAVTMAPVASSWSSSGSAFRATWTNASGNPNDGDIAVHLSVGTLQPDTRYTLTYRLRGPNRTSTIRPQTVFSPAADSFVTLARSTSSNETLNANQITMRWVTFQATSASLTAGLRAIQTLESKVSGDFMEVSDIMLYEGDYDPAKSWKWGNSPGWRWNGAPNASTSTGPPL